MKFFFYANNFLLHDIFVNFFFNFLEKKLKFQDVGRKKKKKEATFQDTTENIIYNTLTPNEKYIG